MRGMQAGGQGGGRDLKGPQVFLCSGRLDAAVQQGDRRWRSVLLGDGQAE